MKKIIIASLLLLAIFFIFKNKQQAEILENNQKALPTSSAKQKPDKNQNTPLFDTKYFLFFPYWTLPDNIDKITLPKVKQSGNITISNFIYFGVTAGESGVNKSEAGFTNLEKFSSLVSSSPKTLVLRLTNSEFNLDLIDDVDLQNKIIDDTTALAKQYDFKEITLDFELKALPTESTISKVTQFIKRSSAKVKTTGLKFAITVYGDTFYRRRPYDVAALSSLVDQFIIMAYDFHKSSGEPGPNFPLSGTSQYGYDFKSMITDFIDQTPSEKITVAFGLYGHDWIVDDKNRPLKSAQTLTLSQIKQNFLDNCPKTDCKISRDKTSSESTITYKEDNKNHVIWFEDERSIGEKIDYLKTKGINGTAFWAYGYY